jgi:hypothetical protein
VGVTKIQTLVVFAAVVATVWINAATTDAANSPTFRDCSLAGGLDPDFVVLTGATADSQGNLTVTQAQTQVTLMASESAEPGDQSGHDTFTVTVSAPGVAPRTLSGTGVGHATLSVPLSGARVGSAYTITWAATFDNGQHPCPSGLTPQNGTSNPFVLNLVASTPTPSAVAPVITDLRQTNRVWRKHNTSRRSTAKLPVGTTFTFILNEPARATLAFTQQLSGRKVGSLCVSPTKRNRTRSACTRTVARGGLSILGRAGVNDVRFRGRLSRSKQLKPGRYTLVMTATSGGLASRHRSIRFTISP